MLPDGDSLYARWREAGEWWNNQPYTEYLQYFDSRGILTTETKEMPCLGQPLLGKELEPRAKPTPEDNREEWSLRIKKMRDEKVKRAFGEKSDAEKVLTVLTKSQAAPYVLLHTKSGYSFGQSPLLAEEIPPICASRGISGCLLADRFSLAGAMEFFRMCRQVGIKPLIGATLELEEGGEIVLVAQNATGYQNLSRLITACHLEEPRGYPLASWERLSRYTEGILCLTGGHSGPINRYLIPKRYESAHKVLERLVGMYGQGKVWAEVERSLKPWEKQTNQALIELCGTLKVPLVAGMPSTLTSRDHLCTLDVLTCIETLCKIDEVEGRKPHRDPSQVEVTAWPRRPFNAEGLIRNANQFASLYQDHPEWIANTLRFADLCDENAMPQRTTLPRLYPDAEATLREVTYQGAALRYRRIAPSLLRRIEWELGTITKLGFADHFLVAWDMCNWAEANGMIYSGRGSVVDSVIAYCLGFSRIDAYRHKLHFDRFLPRDGTKRPDIDIDFEAHRREDVRQYLVGKYGQKHVATVCAFGAYLTRGIIREVGKVMGLPDSTIGSLAKRIHGSVSPAKLEEAIQARPELRNSELPIERYRWIFRLSERLMDIPRNIRAHSSGVVISATPIEQTVPVQLSGADEVKILQWDKRSAKHCFDKFDVLCLRGNDVLSGTQEKIRLSEQDFRVNHVQINDEETYRAMRSGQTIGIPQSASPAMRQAHIRLRTKDLTDASLVQAGIRPGVGGAVKINELIARRRGKPYSFNHPKLEEILGNTYGIIVFQEQVDQLLQAFAGCSPGEAEEIRESIHKRRREKYGEQIQREILDKILAQGYSQSVAEDVFGYVSGFEGYGFAQGHALAFAEISVRSIWCQQNYPAEYFSALFNAQPAGYYGPHTLANEARNRGIAMLPPDVNLSQEGFEPESIVSRQDPKIFIPSGGIRIGLKQILGLSLDTRQRIVANRAGLPYRSLFDFSARVRPDRDELEKLILCGALDAIASNRRQALWAIPSVMSYTESVASMFNSEHPTLPLYLPEPNLPEGISDFNLAERAVEERRYLDLDIERHIVSFERSRIIQKGGVTGLHVQTQLKDGESAFVVGNPIRLRFPPTSSGKRVVFFDLEDETGLLNVTLFDDTYQRYGHALICNPYVTVRGRAQDRDGHMAFLGEQVYPYAPSFAGFSQTSELPLVSSDFLVG